MRKIRTGKKIARVMALGLATVITLTSVPVTVNGDEQDPVTGEAGDTPILVDAIIEEKVDDAEGQAQAAEEYTGEFSVNDDTNAGKGSGDIGSEVADTWNDIEVIKQAQDAFVQEQGDLLNAAGEVEKAVDELAGTSDPGNNGEGQIADSEKQVNIAADNDHLGVKFDKDGKIVNQDVLNKNVENANEAIDIVEGTEGTEGLKTSVESGLDGVEQAINTANSLITTANEKKTDADNKEKTPFSSQDQIDEKKNALDNETREALEGITNTLQNAIDRDDISESVTAVEEASAGAAQVAGEKLTVAQNAFKEVQDAANEAQDHSTDYNRDQMVSLATRAQQAANGAQQAADLAD